MPYPTQVTYEELVETAWQMVESDGFDQLSLAKLAAQFGIKAPSLYKHVHNKAALIRAVNDRTVQRLFLSINQALSEASDDPLDQVTAVAHAYRNFGLAHPTTYKLAYTTVDPEEHWDPVASEQAVMPLQAIIARITGEANAHAALRGMMALLHGFVMLEMHDQLLREGSIDAAFSQSVAAYLRGWDS